jgi:hypothetical protein
LLFARFAFDAAILLINLQVDDRYVLKLRCSIAAMASVSSLSAQAALFIERQRRNSSLLSTASAGKIGEGALSSDGSSGEQTNVMLAQECATLKDDMALMTARHDATMQALKDDLASKLDEERREGKRAASMVAKESREATRRIVQLSSEIARLKEQLEKRPAGSFPEWSNSTPPPASSSATHSPTDERSVAAGVVTAATYKSMLTTRDSQLSVANEQIARLEAECSALRESVASRDRDLSALRIANDLQSNKAASALPQGAAEQQRELTKRVVALANEVARVQKERDEAVATEQAISRVHADNAKKLAVVTGEATLLRTRLAETEAKLQDCAAEIGRIGSALDELNTAKQDLSRLRACQVEWDKKEQHFIKFRAQHESCSEAIVDQRQKIFTLETQLQRLEAKLSEHSKDANSAGISAEEARKKLFVAQEEIESHKRQAAVDKQRFREERDNQLQVIDQLRRKLDEETRCKVEFQAGLEATQRALADQRAAYEKISGAKSNAENALERAQDAGAELVRLRESCTAYVAEVAQLTDQSAAAKQEIRRLETERAAADQDHQKRKTQLQQINLELQEANQKIAAAERDSSRIRRERDELMSRMVDMEGSHIEGATNTTTRRLTGLLESMTIEVSQQVAESLRTEFMRGGTRTATVFKKTFNLDADVAREMVDVLAHLYLMIRTHSDTEAMCRMLGVKEITVRRIISGFTAVMERFEPGPRRRQLSLGSPAASRITFRGAARLHFLVCASRPQSSLHVLYDESVVLAKVCSFLVPTVKGFPAFAYHVWSHGEGQSIFLYLDHSGGTFVLHEARLSPKDGVNAVRLHGSFCELGVEDDALGTCRLELSARGMEKCTAAWEEPATWSAPDGDATTTAVLKVILRWDRKHNGLSAEIAGGARLSESTRGEAETLKQFFDGRTVEALSKDMLWRREG